MEGITRIESERIVNLNEYETLISEARANMMWLKKHLEDKDYGEARHLAGQIDLALHKMEEHEFCIERRIVIVNNHHAEC